MKKILCIDFDNTLCYNSFPNIKQAKRAWIHKLILWYCKYLKKRNWYIILNTCRKEKTLKDAIKYLKNLNFIPDLVNENAKWLIDQLGNTRKISCDLNIDDANFGLLGFILKLYKNKD